VLVVVPYVPGQLHARVLPAIRRQGYIAWPHSVADEPYSELLARLFGLLRDGLDALAVVEHDVESRAGCLRAYEDCPRPWCYHAYDFAQPYDETVPANFAPLGHVRFRRELAGELLTVAASAEWGSAGYQHLDRMLYDQITTRAGVGPHRHPGKVTHWHDYAAERV
jgi:hypothetical protein